MERKLVTIRKISKVEKHPNADTLDICTVDGWKVITKLGEFEEGDLVVYFEVDSFLPIRPEFEFLRKFCYKKLSDDSEGFRLKTIRLRGILSQGLLMPVDILLISDAIHEINEVSFTNSILVNLSSAKLDFGFKDDNWKELKVGDDLTELLGVKKI